MINLYITKITTACPNIINTSYFNREELINIFYENGIKVVDDYTKADLEISSYDNLLSNGIIIPHFLPKNRVIFIDGEPPQIFPNIKGNSYFYPPYLNSYKFAKMITPIDNLYSDPFAYFIKREKDYTRNNNINKNKKISLFSTYREVSKLNRNLELSGVINNLEELSLFYISSITRIQVGLKIFKNNKYSIDIFGKNWPDNLSKKNDRDSNNWAENKLNILDNYSFDIAIENSIIDNYTSEKLWHPIVKGVLPIAWTCNEMHNLLPKNSVIDLREYINFEKDTMDYDKLIYDLENISEQEYKNRVNTLYDWYESLPNDLQYISLKKSAYNLCNEIKNIYNNIDNSDKKQIKTRNNSTLILNNKINKQDDLVSVIMAAYNVEKTLYDAAISVLNQTYKNLELIIINDGSKDNTEKIAKELMKKDNRIRYIKQNNKKLGAARNKGISIARGKYIKILDSDDILLENSIELLVKEIKKDNNTKIVFGNYIINSYGNIGLSSINKIQIDRNEFLIKQLIDNLIGCGTNLIDKSIFDEIGYFDENLGGVEDYDLWNRIIKKYDYSHIAIPIYIYMIYEGEQLTKDIEKLRYYTDIATNRLLSSIDLRDLFSNYSDNINDIPTLIDNLIKKMLKRVDTCYDTILKLIDKAQEISYSKNRDNKKIELFNDNNIRGINYIENLYNNLKSNINIDSYNKLSLNKFFFIKDNEIIRYFYQNTYLNFVTENNNRIISSSWYLSIMNKDIIDYINNHIDLLLVPSQFVLENISNLGILEDKIKILNEFIDYDIFKPLDIEKYNDFTFIYSGKIDYISGIDILIEVFKDEFKNKNAKLIIHCNGIYDIDYLENLKKQLSDNIQIILDNFSDNELNEFINKAHCFVYPYRLEGSLSNILKPIASNIPIITNNCISKDLPKELINTIDCNFIIDKNILLGDIETIGTFSYYEADKNSLKSKMKDIYSNYDNYIDKSTKLREYILNNYSKEKSISNLNKYIDEINKEIVINNNLDNYKDLLYQKGKEYFNNKDYRKAEQYFNLLISYDKKVNYYLALSLYYQGKYEKSIEYFVNSITSKFIDYEILNSLSDSLYKMGDIKTSNYYKQKALLIK